MEKEYYKSKESVEEYIHLAKDVNGGAIIEKLKGYLQKDSKVLELGSGPGSDWELLSKNYTVTGSDFSNEFLAHLESKFPSGKFMRMDASTLDTDEKFDGIYANKVLHHLTDEELHLSVERQSEVLNPEGVVCHTFWKGEGSETFKGMFVNYHTEEGIRGLFEANFEVLLIESYAEFDEGDSILIIGKKKDV